MEMAKVNELHEQIQRANDRISANIHTTQVVKHLRKDVMAKRVTSFVLHMDGTAITINATGKHGGVKRLNGLFDAMISDCKDAIAKDCAEITWCSEQLTAMLDN